MTTLLGILTGYKTILVAIGALLYAIGIHFGWWAHYPDIDLAFGGAGAITIRLAIKNLCKQVSDAMDRIGPGVLALLAALTVATGALSLQSCATILPGNDPVVVNAERTTALAADTFDTFLKLEYDNQALVKAHTPAVHTYAETVRAGGVDWLQSARVLTRAYKLNRTPENRVNLQTALGVLAAAQAEAQKYITQINTFH